MKCKYVLFVKYPYERFDFFLEPPSRPNGIMSGYQIFRRMVYPCPTRYIPQAFSVGVSSKLIAPFAEYHSDP